MLKHSLFASLWIITTLQSSTLDCLLGLCFFISVCFFSPFPSQPKALSLMDEFLITLVRLRLNLMCDDLAYRFRVLSSTASYIFHKWLDLMYVRLKFSVAWPSKEIIEENISIIFKQPIPLVLMHNRLLRDLRKSTNWF